MGSVLRGQPEQRDDFLQALEILMPLKDLPRTGTTIRARMHQDLHTNYPEFWLELHHSGLRNVSMEVRAPDGLSVYEQLADLRDSHPESPLDELTGSLRMKKWEFTAAECPEVRQTPHTFPTTTWSRPSVIFIHPMVFEMAFRLPHRDGYLHVTDDEQPPILWLLELRGLLEACVVRKDPKAFFLTRGTWGLSSRRWAEINGLVQLQLPEGNFGVLETLRVDLDQDGKLDLLVLYERFKEDDSRATSFLKIIPGIQAQVEPFEIGGPGTIEQFVSAGAGEILLSLKIFDKWPPDSEDEPTNASLTVYFRRGRLTGDSPEQ